MTYMGTTTTVYNIYADRIILFGAQSEEYQGILS